MERDGEAAVLSEAELGHYRDNGFVVPDFHLPEKTIEAIRADHTRLVTEHPEFIDYCPTVLAYDLSFLNYARIPAIAEPAANDRRRNAGISAVAQTSAYGRRRYAGIRARGQRAQRSESTLHAVAR